MLHRAGLLQQVIEAAAAAGVPLSGENALQRYDQYAFDRIAESALGLNARAGRCVTAPPPGSRLQAVPPPSRVKSRERHIYVLHNVYELNHFIDTSID